MPTIPIRWADNTKELAANLKAGLSQIEATRAGADKLAQSLGGDNLVRAAHGFSAAIQKLGGVQNLTASNQARVNSVMTRAVEVLNAAGQGSSDLAKHFQSLADASTSVGQKTAVFGDAFKSVFAGFTAANVVDRAVTGLISIGKEAFNSASQIHDLALELGISTDAVQGFKAAAVGAGSNVEAVGKAINRMNDALATGSNSTVQAFKDAGLEFEKVRAMSVEDAFLAITDAIQKIPDPALRAQVRLELLGKAGNELGTAIQEGFRQAAEGADKMSAQTIKDLEAAQDAWEKLGNQVVIITGKMIAASIGATRQIMSNWQQFFQFAENVVRLGPGIAFSLAAMGDAANQTPAVPENVPASTGPTIEEQNRRAAAAKKSASDLKQAQEEFARSLDQAMNAARRLFGELDKLNLINVGLRESVGGVADGTLQEVRAWLQANDAVEKLYDSVRKLEQVKAGVVDLGNLPSGTVDNETIPRLKTHLDGIVTSTDKWLEGLSAVAPLLRVISSAGQQTFTNMGQRITAALEGVIQLIQNFIKLTAAIKAANTAAQISQGLGLVLSAISIGLAFVAKGGVVTSHGVQRFAGGGFAQPTLKVPGFARGTDSVPAMLTPGEMVLNAGQQARLFQIANGHTSPDREAGGSMNVVVNLNAPHAMNVDRHVLARWGRMLAPEIAKAISQNKDSSYTHFRAALGMPS